MQVYGPSGSRAETYADRVGMLLINHNRNNVTKGRDIWTDSERVVCVHSYTVSQKTTTHRSLVHNFAKCLPIFEILSLLDSAVNLQ